MRGFAVLAMIIDHIGGKDSWLYAITGGDRFFVSTAEGFVFISGLVMGIVYARIIARHGLKAALIKGARRVGTLYALAVGLSLFFAATSIQLGLSWASSITDGNAFGFVLEILTLHRAFYLTDVLLLYTLVVAAALPLLVIIKRGFSWLVLAGSWALWAAWQWWPEQVQIPWAIADSSTFNFSAWQVLFVTALVIGYHRSSWESRAARMLENRARLPVLSQLAVLIITATLIGSAIAFYLWAQTQPGAAAGGSQLAQIFGKSDVRLGRLLLFGCFFVFMFLLSTIAWTPIKKLFGWLLLPLGRDALTAYTLHLFLVTLTAMVVSGADPNSRWANTAIQVVSVFIIWAAVLAKAPGKAYLGAVFYRLKLRLGRSSGPEIAGSLSPTQARGSMSGTAGVAAQRRLGTLAQAGLHRAAMVLAGMLLITALPVVATSLKSNNSETYIAAPLDASEMSAPSQTAVAASNSAADSSEADSIDFGLLFSGTAVPSVVPTVIVSDLPVYLQKGTFLSVSLNRMMPYYVYLPPSYNANPDARYPVLYMLHGLRGTNAEWLGYGLPGRARDMMSVGQISEFIIVMPQGDQGYWIDHANGGPRWGTYVAHDVVKEVDANFRTIADPQHRAIGGLSMGGYAALLLSMSYPDVFGVAGAHSASFHTLDTAPSFFGDETYFSAHDPVALYKANPGVAHTLKLWVDYGDKDDWLPAATALHDLLLAQGVAYEWHVLPGGHDGEYWSSNIVDYLKFYSSALNHIE